MIIPERASLTGGRAFALGSSYRPERPSQGPFREVAELQVGRLRTEQGCGRKSLSEPQLTPSPDLRQRPQFR